MLRTLLSELRRSPDQYGGKTVTVGGWCRNIRASNAFGFIELNDGSTLPSLQVVIEDSKLDNYSEIAGLNIGAAIIVTGVFTLTPEAKQPYELKADKVEIEGASDPEYPIQNKRHTREFLRTMVHLRPRTNTFNAVFRVRSEIAFAIHKFFNDRGFVYVHTPLITTSDCEGAGEMFRVTTIDCENPPRGDDGKIDWTKDFFGKEAFLTVSGQLNGEAMAQAFGNIYTFGPTFRAENSNTKTHASEFWMIEPEIAFCDIAKLMDIEEDFLKAIVRTVLEKCPDELEFLDKFSGGGLVEKLKALADAHFARVSHDEAITILRAAGEGRFEFEPKYGEDTAKEHEKYLTEEYFHGPVFIYDWPKDIKAFYMYQNDDGKTVAGVDLLVPGSGELMGGSQREHRLERLTGRMDELGISKDQMDWYVNLRRFGGCVHSGFGMGFERLIMYLTAVENIRDVIPYPRTPRECDF